MTSTHPVKYIFCVSPGRSGTHYLYHIFSCAQGVCAVHEPEHEHPEYARLKPQLWDLKGSLLSGSLAARTELKSTQINDLLSRSTASVYAETNPLFSTLWYDAVFNALPGQEITVLILRRNTAEVLKSLLDLGWFNGRDGNDWMVTAYSVNSLVRPIVTEQEATPFERITGYLLNVEMYAQKIKHQCHLRGHKVIELHSNQLFGNSAKVLDLMGQCGLDANDEKLAAIITERKNKPPTRKKQFNVPLDICKRELEYYFQRCEGQGIEVPELPYR